MYHIDLLLNKNLKKIIIVVNLFWQGDVKAGCQQKYQNIK